VNAVSCTRDGGVLRIVLDRPQRLNAVNTTMLREIEARLHEAREEAVRVVALTGAGRVFCSGGDLSGEDTEGAAAAANDVVQAITALPKPVVAGVRGAAAGFGCPLALACDLVVAARSAVFQLAFTTVGLMPDGGSSVLVPGAIGRARATRMAMLGEKIPATTAFEWGMISHVVDDDAYQSELDAVVGALAAGPTQSYGWVKRALAAATLPALARAQAIEAEGQQALTGTADFREGVRSFRRRTRPNFRGS
jgi:enoyl-CoA hydratase